ncbi:hypothetical protein [Paenibacillus qinlingensis]|uniref:Heparinase II/III-like protein n=1 Tax=Paenibacillus qinlingensis TaxID=1837343 RepID=A0ABU1P5T8_9BACL|nr:hypothetical protein [Paenibacillus qinlingensis]MDR6554914.1 hypothetical protein [Paenibacillus qinlingensis]
MDRDELLRAIQATEKQYDAGVKLVRTPLTATYHTALKPEQHPFVYALYPSTCYAYDLLRYGGEAYSLRAAEILEVVIAQQDQDASRASYGIWPYFYEESLDEMDRPDWNMADFHGKRLVLILKKYADSLPQSLVNQIREAIYHACQAIMIRNVGPHYTNIAIMGAFVTLVGGELLGDNEIQSYGEQRLKRFHVFTSGIGTFSEYNSPCYSPLAIEELDSIYQESHSTEAVALAEQLLDIAWGMIAKHYHPATREWGGPYSRTYFTLMTEREKHFLGNALNKETTGIKCPEQYHAYFSSNEERYFMEPTLLAAETGYQNYATTYQNDKLSLGSYTIGSMWNQRRNLLAFVDVGGKKVFVQLQFLKDGRDFCSAIFTGVQSRNHVLYGFNLATDNGDWHQDLDVINGKFQAKDLRIRLLLGGDLQELELPTLVEGKRLTTLLGDTQLRIEAILEESDYGSLEVAAERSGDELYLDYVLYAGEEKAFDFHAIQKAVWLFQLSLGNAADQLPEVDVRQEGNSVTATIATKEDQMSITVPAAPGKTNDFYRNNRVQPPQSLLQVK